MNQTDAANLARDITQTWQLTPTTRIWVETLEPMTDHTAAKRAYIHLRRNHAGRDMTIGAFTDEYKRQRRLAAADDLTTAAEHCHRCSDGALTYWVNHNGNPYRYAARCSCSAGRRWPHLAPMPWWVPDTALGAAGTPCGPPADPPTTEAV